MIILMLSSQNNIYGQETGEIISGGTINGNIEIGGQLDSYTFNGRSGQGVYIEMSAHESDLGPALYLYGPDGTLETELIGYISDNAISLKDHQLNQSGTYTIVAGASTAYATTTTGQYGLSVVLAGASSDQESKDKNMFEDIPVTEVVVVTGTAVTTITLLGILTTAWGKYKFFSFLSLFSPLYLRTVREDVFNNEKRLSMYNHIAENQPVVYSDIKRSCNLSHGEINWHAGMMEQLGLIHVERRGFNVFFKLSGKTLPTEKFIRLTDTQKIIFDLIKNNPGITQAEIVEKVGLKQQNISYNLLKLEEKGKIRFTKQGKNKIYYHIE